MNLERFIAKRILGKEKFENRISRPVIRVAITGIALGICTMILSVAIVTGFQKEIRNKVIGFGSHIQIKSAKTNNSYESTPLVRDDELINYLESLDGVSHVQAIAHKPGILRSGGDTLKQDSDKAIISRDIQGIILKGISTDFKNDFFKSHLKEGRFITLNTKEPNDSIVVSEFLAKKLKLNLNERVSAFFVENDGPSERKFIIAGIYSTGLEEFDKEFVFVDLRQVQRLNHWGVSTNLMLSDQCEQINNGFVVESFVRGGNGYYLYDWDGSWKKYKNAFLPYIKDTTIQLVTADFDEEQFDYEEEPISIPDTAWLSINVLHKPDSLKRCYCTEEEIFYEILNDSTRKYNLNGFEFTTTLTTSGGSGQYYTGGFELLIDNWEDLVQTNEIVEKGIDRTKYNASTIVEEYMEIFRWLEMLDTNVLIIIVLMIIVAVINMTTALLVLILERTTMIGVLKAIGANNWSIREIFIYNATYLIGKGLLYGNLLALIIGLSQQYFGWFQLPGQSYYVSVVPVNLDILHILLLNAGTVVVCVFMMLFPSYLVTKISPVKAIRFD